MNKYVLVPVYEGRVGLQHQAESHLRGADNVIYYVLCVMCYVLCVLCYALD